MDLSTSIRGETYCKLPIFEKYKEAAGKFRFRLKAANGEIIAFNEAYELKA